MLSKFKPGDLIQVIDDEDIIEGARVGDTGFIIKRIGCFRSNEKHFYDVYIFSYGFITLEESEMIKL